MKNTEIENTKLVKEIQTFKNLDANKEKMISYYKEEVGRLQLLIAEKENMKKAILHSSSDKVSSTQYNWPDLNKHIYCCMCLTKERKKEVEEITRV